MKKLNLNDQTPTGYIATKCERWGNVLLTFLEKEPDKTCELCKYENTNYAELPCNSCKFVFGGGNISRFEPKQQPILCTHDGVELFEKDKCWAVDGYMNYKVIQISKDPKTFIDYTLFSTIEATQKWIENEKEIKRLQGLINSIENDVCLCQHNYVINLIEVELKSLNSELNQLKTENNAK